MVDSVDFSLTVPSSAMSMITGGGIVLLSVLIVMIIVIAKRWGAKYMPVLMGFIAFLLAFACQWGLITGLSLIPSLDVMFMYNPTALTIITCMVSAASYMIMRILLVNMLVDRYETKGSIYMAGIGFGLGNALLYGFTALGNYTMCISINSDGLEATYRAAVAGMSEADAYVQWETMLPLLVAPSVYWLLEGLSCAIDLVIEMVLTNVIFGAVKGHLPKYWYGLSALITFVTMLSFQLADESSMTSIAVFFALKLVFTVVSLYYAHVVAAKEIEYSEDKY